MSRLKEIEARLAALEGNYDVHVECGGEFDVASRICHGCGKRLGLGSIVRPSSVTQASYAADVSYLLRRLKGRRGAAEGQCP